MLIDSNKLIAKLEYERERWRDNIDKMDNSLKDESGKTLEAEAIIMAFNQALSIVRRMVSVEASRIEL